LPELVIVGEPVVDTLKNVGAAAIVAVLFELALTAPAEFVPVTTQRTVFPTSAA
jgi:hypothetical protein